MFVSPTQEMCTRRIIVSLYLCIFDSAGHSLSIRWDSSWRDSQRGTRKRSAVFAITILSTLNFMSEINVFFLLSFAVKESKTKKAILLNSFSGIKNFLFP